MLYVLTLAGALGPAGLSAAVVAGPPNGWATFIPAITALVVALTGLVGVVITLVKLIEAKTQAKATETRVSSLGEAAQIHETRLDQLYAEQARLEALTGIGSHGPKG